ncbi:MAG TPA: DUF6072 family protein [Thermoanaerobaculia bacterium]|jgi:hypothetical protein|nr:DUF6072 family protein [Thermoanaerobaculia bacterium]
MANEKTGAEILGVGVKAASEYVIPGGSNLIKGDLATGVTHAALGFLAKAAFGLPGLIAVSLNSLTKSVTGKNALEYLGVWEDRSHERHEHHPVERRPAAE